MWNHGQDKILRIIQAIEQGFNKIIEAHRKDQLIDLIKLYNETFKPVKKIPPCQFSSAIFPLEPVKDYKPSDLRLSDLHMESGGLREFLNNQKIAVGTLDSSTYNSGPHITVNITVVNVGYWYMNYETNNGGDGNYAEVILNVSGGIDEQICIKDIEFKVLDDILIEKLNGDKKFLLLDESLSLIYTLSWTMEARKLMAQKIGDIIENALKSDIIPVGVYYTRTADIVRGMLTAIGKSLEELPIIPDRTLLNHVLSKGSRSPLFIVHSKPLQEIGLEILCFYVKLGERNIIRVEFPREAMNTANDIHNVVLLQSILGGGYPLAMQRAHEMAVLRADERRIIEEEICRRLNIPTVDYLLSKKVISKRWPIV